MAAEPEPDAFFPVDPQGVLPPDAAAALQRIADAREHWIGARGGWSTREEDAHRALRNANAALEQMRAAPPTIEIPLQNGRRIVPDEKKVREIELAVRTAEADLERVRQKHNDASERANQAGALFTALIDWVQSRPDGTRFIADTSPVKLPARDPGAAVSAARAKREKLEEQLQAVRSAPRAPGEVIEQIQRELRDLAAAGAPDVDAAIARGEKVAWPQQHVGLSGAGRYVSGEIPSAPALVAWLFEDELAGRLDALVRERVDETTALTAEQREAQELELAAKILTTEREEEVAIRAAEGIGLDILRRPDADPRAVLGLADSLQSPMEG